MYKEFVRNRITQLRLLLNISEKKMSRDLGNSPSYINNITSGKSLPSMQVFFDICDYCNITPAEFFDEDIKRPDLAHKINEGLKDLSDDDILLILGYIERLQK